MTVPVLVVGDIVTDVVAIVDQPLAHASDTRATIAVTGGGAGANTSAWLAYAGLDVTLCAVVGADPAGDARVAELAAQGIRCAVRRTGEAATGTIVVIAERDERSFLTDRGANLRLRPADIDAAIAAGHRPPVHLHLSGYPLLEAPSRPAAAHALARAAEMGMTVSVDAASAGPLRHVPEFLDWVRGVDLLFANTDEAEALTGSRAGPADLAGALARQVRTAIVKLGAAGAVAATSGDVVSVPAQTARVIDATGAGDAFAAGFLRAWLTPPPSVMDALRSGATLGARAVSVVGARPDPAHPGRRRSSSAAPTG